MEHGVMDEEGIRNGGTDGQWSSRSPWMTGRTAGRLQGIVT